MKLKDIPVPSDVGTVVWTLYKLRRKLVIQLEEKTVWEMEYVKLFDRDYYQGVFSQKSMKAWSKTVGMIMFTKQDTASISYRAAGTT